MKGIDVKIVSSVIFSVLFVLLLFTPVYGSSDWVEYGKSKNGNVFSYNRVNIKRTKNRVHVWIRTVFSDEGREKEIQPLRTGGLPTEEWEKLSHTLVLDEISCKERKHWISSITYYNTDGRVFFSHSYDKSNWDYIIPGSTVDILRNNVCK